LFVEFEWRQGAVLSCQRWGGSWWFRTRNITPICCRPLIFNYNVYLKAGM
jgi:hypothetical protein